MALLLAGTQDKPVLLLIGVRKNISEKLLVLLRNFQIPAQECKQVELTVYIYIDLKVVARRISWCVDASAEVACGHYLYHSELG